MGEYRFEIKQTLEKKLIKIKKKDRSLFIAVREKIKEITENPFRYKPLKYDLKGLRRTHIKKSFVLVFEIDESSKSLDSLI